MPGFMRLSYRTRRSAARHDQELPPSRSERRRVNWEALGAISAALTCLVIAVTAFVSVDQLRQLRGQRQDAAAVELVRSLQDDSFVRSCRFLLATATDSPESKRIAQDDQFKQAMLLLGFRFEMLGVLVYREAVPFDVAAELVGGLVIETWRRLKPEIEVDRQTPGWRLYLEWFEWLAEQLEARGRSKQQPSYVSHADWQPLRRSGLGGRGA